MRAAKCTEHDYIDYLIVTPRGANCCEAARSGPPGSRETEPRLL